MRKKLICIALVAVLLLAIVPPQKASASNADQLDISNEFLAVLKQFEGFMYNGYPYWDYGQYSIGYGSSCKADEYPNGITEAKADELLRAELVKLEPYLDKFAKKYSLSLSQQQYDALICFTYNLGTNWMNNESTLRSAIISGAEGNDLIFAMTMWCNAGGKIQTGLVQRRMAEANLYLNGV